MWLSALIANLQAEVIDATFEAADTNVRRTHSASVSFDSPFDCQNGFPSMFMPAVVDLHET